MNSEKAEIATHRAITEKKVKKETSRNRCLQYLGSGWNHAAVKTCTSNNQPVAEIRYYLGSGWNHAVVKTCTSNNQAKTRIRY